MPVDWTEIRQEYETTDITLLDLGQKYDIKYPTIKSRKQRQGWSKDASKSAKDASEIKDASKRKRSGPPIGSRYAAGHGAPKGNKNAVGNNGGEGGPPGNSKAVTHGMFRKYFPDESVEIMEHLGTRSAIDILWDNIVIQYTAIIRAQKIMFVRDQQDETRVVKKEKHTSIGGEIEKDIEEFEWEYQHSWDKHATFLQAQSRAMATMQAMISRYESLCRQGTADEEQQLRIEKLKAEVREMNKTGDSGDRGGLDQLAEMIKKSAEMIRGDE